mmetsp:Transcript_54931/g.98685  ORF Transcript_54931/g.98685 Transcript_54931/m.98685 type:complete len:380 (+) Transcript_54931:89-1228(+)
MIYVFFFTCIFHSLSADLNETLCDAASADLACDSEDGLTHLDMSLLQLGLQVRSEAEVPEPSGVHKVKTLSRQLVENSIAATSAEVLGMADTKASWLQMQTKQQQVLVNVVLLVLIILLLALLCAIARFTVRKNEGGERYPGSDAVLWQPAIAPAAASLLVAGAQETPNLQSSQETRPLPSTPPLCPSLILPRTEARFMIAMDSLHSPLTGSIHILGRSGRRLLHCSISPTTDGRRCLALASIGCEDDPRALVFTPPPSSMQVDLHIGRSDAYYGHIESPPGSSSSILHYGESHNPVMYLELGSYEDLQISATSAAGNVMAFAGKTNALPGSFGLQGRQPIGNDVWKLNVKPGADPLLVASCMLALILLKPWSGDSRGV